MKESIQNLLLERFITYVKIDTQSDDTSKSIPSTSKQYELARLLEKELKNMGLTEVELTDKCYLSASLPENTKKDIPVIGFIAHMDTSPEVTGKNVKPLITGNYSGEDLIINQEKHIVLSISEFPVLKSYKGNTLICTDGTTLLGADNKAGIAEIITSVEYLVKHPEIKHGKIKICFTPDEEIGRGADFFDVEKFNADFAYTIDSGPLGNLEYETFNAAAAKVFIKGKNVHPGAAKGVMVNALQVAMEFNNMLPNNERPEYTSDYEGFYHLIKFDGNVEHAELNYIVRDHDKFKFHGKKREMIKIAEFLNNRFHKGTVEVDLKDQYYNMREEIEKNFHIVELAKQAFVEAGIQPNIEPVRGGTDGARLSYMGLPTPNIFTGGHNFHSKFEFIVLESMLKTVEVIVNIVKSAAK